MNEPTHYRGWDSKLLGTFLLCRWDMNEPTHCRGWDWELGSEQITNCPVGGIKERES